jgi:monofunctional biosynthetic peptidoglycan transglycosylase
VSQEYQPTIVTTVRDEPLAAGGTMDLSSPKKHRSWKKWLWKGPLYFFVITILQVLVLRVVNPPVTTMMIFQSMGHLFSGESPFWSHTNLGSVQIPRNMMSAVVAAEDQRFFSHGGFDLVEIAKVQREAERRNKPPKRGASTISQQVAKNLFLPPWRNFIRKGIEAYYTVLIEFLWPKERILQMYVNIAEFAPGVYGVEAAARHHFRRSAKQLTPMQCALLASVLPNPARWSASKPSRYIQRRAGRIVRQMRGIPTSDEEDGDPD